MILVNDLTEADVLIDARPYWIALWEQYRLALALARSDPGLVRFQFQADEREPMLFERFGPEVPKFAPSPYTCLVCRDTLIVRGHAWDAWRRAIGFREHTYCPVCMPGVFGPACEQPSLLSLELPHA